MIQVKIVNESPYPLPEYQTAGSAGMDMYAHLTEPLTLPSLGRFAIPTGIRIELPEGYEAQIRPRSGLALKKGLSLPNTPATIDSDYRGELKVIIINLSPDEVTIEPGERIAQMVIARYERIEWVPTTELSDTVRSTGGFGSTGTK